MDKLIVTAGLTGSGISKEQTPHIPITPDEIVRSGVEASAAGASVLHVHVRDTETGLGTQDLAVFEPIVDRLRAETDAVLCLTTSGIPGRNLPTEERIAPLSLRPELASFDAGSINTLAGVFLNPPEFLDALAARALELGVKLELECFDAGHVATCLRYLDGGKLSPPLHFQFVLGAPYGMPATAASLVHLTGMIPADATWSVIGIGRTQTQMSALGIIMGGHSRVGLEDNIYYSRGVLAEGNAQLVERVVRLAGELGREVATPAEARTILALR
jgi:3-keto-5-aminohexanoate cleavage enzyme